MNDFNILVTILGAASLMLGLGSRWLARSPFPPTLVALGMGVVLGPELLKLINLEQMGERASLMEKAARLTLGIGLTGVALRIPREFPRRNWRQMLLLVGIGMLLMWAISTALVFLVLGLPFRMAALVNAIITPTDPVAASPIVTGEEAEKNIPEPIRHAVSLESGANDGLGYLFVFLPFLVLTRPAGEAFSHWLTRTLLSGLWLVVAVLLLRRPPVLLLLRPWLGAIRTTPDALFVGWFGPIAVAAIYYASLMEHRAGEPVIWHAVSLVICGSVVAHGLTGAALTRALGRSAAPGCGTSAD